MIRRRSYAEAIAAGAFDGEFINSDSEFVDKNTGFVDSMRRSYISSSSEESGDDGKDENTETSRRLSENVKPNEFLGVESECRKATRSNEDFKSKNVAFVRSNSLNCYNAKPAKSEVVCDYSVEQIYNTCVDYMSDDSFHSKKGSRNSDFSGLHKILAENKNISQTFDSFDVERSKLPVKVDVGLPSRTSFHVNVNAIRSNFGEQNLRIVENHETSNADRYENRMENPGSLQPVTTKIFDDIYTANDDDDDDFYDDETKEVASSGINSNFPLEYVGRNSTKKKRKTPENCGNRSRRLRRVVYKSGQINVPLLNNILGRSKIYFNDFVTTLIECQWRWIVFLFSACNFIVWIGFALMFYVAAYANGDLDENPTGNLCIADGKTFTGIFTFSVETQVSIGYGEKYPTEECPEVTFILLMEVVVGNAMIGAMVSIVFAKIIRPEKHLCGVGFSKNAVVCKRDGQLCFVIRVWDTLQKHAIGTHVRGWFIKHRMGSGPLILPLSFGSAPFILWPATLQHVIDEKSPLYDLSAKDLLDRKFEIVITLTGAARNTGLMTQSRTSYMSHEILWGSRFKEIVSYSEEEGSYIIDAKSINSVESVDVPLCSARLLRHFNNALQGGPQSISLPASPIFLSPRDSPRSILASPSWSFKVRKFTNDLNTSLP